MDLRKQCRGVRSIGRPGSSRKPAAVVERDATLAARRVNAQDWPVIRTRCGCAHYRLPLFRRRRPPDDGGVASLPESELAVMAIIVDPDPSLIMTDERGA